MAEPLTECIVACGPGSPRGCREPVLAARATVDGAEVREPDLPVAPGEAEVRADGLAALPPSPAYYLVHKPEGCRCRRGGPGPSVYDLVPHRGRPLVVAGALEVGVSGLVLLTDDEPLARLLAEPAAGVPCAYRVTVAGKLTWRELRRLREGLTLEDGPAAAAEVRLIRCAHTTSKADLTVTSKSSRLVERMFAAVGRRVERLRRIRVGLLELGRLPSGSWRPLRARELDYLVWLRLYRSHQEALRALGRKGAGGR